jgi:hypothetical protein
MLLNCSRLDVSRSRPAGLRISDDFKRYTHPWGEQWSAGREHVNMDEQVATAALIGLDEAEAARQVEEFHCALWHRPVVFVLNFPLRSSGGMAFSGELVILLGANPKLISVSTNPSARSITRVRARKLAPMA